MSGVTLAALAFAAAVPGAAGAASQPASQPSLPGGGTGADATGQVTIILEVDEHHLKVQESWTIQNSSGKRIDRDAVDITLPERSRRLTVDEDTKGFEGAETSDRIVAKRDLGAGAHSIGAAYMVDFDGDTAVLDRPLPVNVNGMRVILEDVPGITVSSNVQKSRRQSELNGLKFLIFDFSPATAGTRLELTVRGLPSRSTTPRAVAIGIVVLIAAGMIFGLARPGQGGPAGVGAMSSSARRDRILKALELLEADKEAGDVKDKAYARRHEALMTELSTVLRELDLEKAQG